MFKHQDLLNTLNIIRTNIPKLQYGLCYEIERHESKATARDVRQAICYWPKITDSFVYPIPSTCPELCYVDMYYAVVDRDTRIATQEQIDEYIQLRTELCDHLIMVLTARWTALKLI